MLLWPALLRSLLLSGSQVLPDGRLSEDCPSVMSSDEGCLCCSSMEMGLVGRSQWPEEENPSDECLLGGM